MLGARPTLRRSIQFQIDVKIRRPGDRAIPAGDIGTTRPYPLGRQILECAIQLAAHSSDLMHTVCAMDRRTHFQLNPYLCGTTAIRLECDAVPDHLHREGRNEPASYEVIPVSERIGPSLLDNCRHAVVSKTRKASQLLRWRGIQIDLVGFASGLGRHLQRWTRKRHRQCGDTQCHKRRKRK